MTKPVFMYISICRFFSRSAALIGLLYVMLAAALLGSVLSIYAGSVAGFVYLLLLHITTFYVIVGARELRRVAGAGVIDLQS